MIKTTDQSVYDDIKEILLDEYVGLLERYEDLVMTKIAMDEVDIISIKLLGHSISAYALERFK